ncbi:putative bifunctional diguanylate cyclase/phosphodiesterase [Tianweitania sp.]|uniref:putative bifunctional diguanylate cyclase/phosphodiesterase n=1 Tax=Tianweitania sp. TaxID=2021634 RepID=UPI00289E6E03|nr:EAL domain-containing protein [Tianweitania sp.]
MSISEDAMYRHLVAGVKDYAIYLLDADGTILNWNEGAQRLKGSAASEIIGKNFELFYTSDDRQRGASARNLRQARSQHHISDEGWRVRKDGSRFWAHVTIDAVYDEAGAFIGFAKITRDMSERRNAERKLLHIASHDGLTRLANRGHFQECLSEELPRVAYGARLAVHYIDLDRFKHVNDTLGHDAGDQLLKQVSLRLKSLAGPVDIVARLGGDEFAVLQNLGSHEEPGRLGAAIVEALDTPFDLGGTPFKISASVGIASSPEHGFSATEILQNADLALYEAKRSGRNRCLVFSHEISALATDRRIKELRLQHAVASESFELHYQPVVSASSGAVVGFEALLRWPEDGEERLFPDEFIPMAERLGLMPHIGTWVLKTACKEAASWTSDAVISVNVSATQLHAGSFVATVKDALELSGLPAQRLELELTETAVLYDIEAAAKLLLELHDLGVMIALDDFGTGFSSLSLVNRLPLDRLKIDKSFVHGMTGSERSLAVIRAVTALCKGYGLRTTAEGVETEQQQQLLVMEGCEELQGFLFGRPDKTPNFGRRSNVG